MKNLIFVMIIFLFSCNGENNKETVSVLEEEPKISEDTRERYDSLFAQKLGADQYGMRRYVMAFLKAGPNRDQDSVAAAQIQRGHMENIQRMADEGKLIVAGPFLDGDEFRGIYIFNVETVEEAEELTKSDPAIEAGRLVMELHPWYGSAALMEVNNIHNSITK